MKKVSFLRCLLLSMVIGLILTFIPQTSEAAIDSKTSIDSLRIAGSGRYSTAVNVSKEGWTNGANTVVLARGDMYPDALAGAPLAKKLDAPILLTPQNELSKEAKSEIKRLKATKVILLGGEAAISKNVEKSVKSLVKNVERISGSDRYLTSLEITRKLGGNPTTAIVATGENFADALAVAPYAAENQFPILLTKQSQLNGKIGEYAKKFSDTVIVGGELAVSNKVEKALPKPSRLAGNSRYETAAEIVSYAYQSNNHVYISTGEQFADALTGAVLAAKKNTAVVLVNKTKVPERVEFLIPEQKVRTLQVLGGKAAVPDSIVNSLLHTVKKYSDTDGAVNLSDQLEMLDKNESQQLENAFETAQYHDDGTMTIKVAANSSLASYKKGDLILIPPDQENPLGLMAQVGEVKTNGNQKEMKLGQPPLEDVFENAKITFDKELTVDDIIDFKLHEGVTIETADGAQVSTFESFENELNKIKQTLEFQSNQNEFMASQPFKLILDTVLYEKDNFSVKLNGKYQLNSTKAKSDINKNGLLKEFDLHFKANQKIDANLLIDWSGDVTLEDKKEKEKEIFEGVDRSKRVTLASVTYTGANFVTGEAAMEKVPVGITIFIVATMSGEIELEGKLNFVDHRSFYIKADWEKDKKEFNFDAEQSATKSTATLAASGNLNAQKSVGLDVGLNIFSLVPAVFENDLREKLEIEGNGQATWDFLDSSGGPEIEGCFSAKYDMGFYSTFKARLKASFAIWEMGFEFEDEFLKLPLFEESIEKCYPSGSVTGTIKNAVSQEPISGTKITAYKDGDYYKSARSTSDGSYEIELQPGTYKLVFEKALYLDEVLNNAEVTRDGLTYNPELKLIYQDFIGEGTVSGKITNALNGESIQGAIIEFRKGINTTAGNVIKTVTTDAAGEYKAVLDAGSYTGIVKKDGYIDSEINVLSIGSLQRDNQNGTMSPILDDSETRIILSWGENPSDLDSHLIGPGEGTDRFHIYYSNQDYYENDLLMAMLDWDDTSSYGPETTTIKEQKDGTYEYFVHDYTNEGYSDSSALAQSDAKVEVYKGSYLVKTFNVPTNKVGTVWKVFELRGNEIIPINSVSDTFTENSFQSTEESSFTKQINDSLLEKKKQESSEEN